MIHVSYFVSREAHWHQAIVHPPSVGDVVEITQRGPLEFMRVVVVLRVWRRNLKDDGSQYLDLMCEPYVEDGNDGSSGKAREAGKAHDKEGRTKARAKTRARA